MRTPHSPLAESSAGFSLLETVVALSMLVAVVLSIVQVCVYAGRSNAIARQVTLGSTLAAEKLEQLQSLAWAYDAAGAPIGDAEADLTSAPERAAGGVGLRISPGSALDRNTAGYCDFLDAFGRSLGGGTSAPAGTAMVRRWAVLPLAVSTEALVIQVRLLSRTAADRNVIDPAAVTLTTVRTRLGW
jgi:type II secretory pathway pseudopilin PulG